MVIPGKWSEPLDQTQVPRLRPLPPAPTPFVLSTEWSSRKCLRQATGRSLPAARLCAGAIAHSPVRTPQRPVPEAAPASRQPQPRSDPSCGPETPPRDGPSVCR